MWHKHEDLLALVICETDQFSVACRAGAKFFVSILHVEKSHHAVIRRALPRTLAVAAPDRAVSGQLRLRPAARPLPRARPFSVV